MNDKINEEQYEQIEQMIASEESVVGIDAKKTHILILHKLMELDHKLDRIEKKLDSGQS